MSNRLYVGNLPYSMTDDLLRQAFAAHGEVISATVVMDRETGRSRGFGFVEMASAADAAKVTQTMSGQLLDGRPITVNEARERAGGGGGRGGGGGYRGGGDTTDGGGGGGYGGGAGNEGGGYGNGGGGGGGVAGERGRRDDRGGGRGGDRDRGGRGRW